MGGTCVIEVYRGWLIIKPAIGEPLVAYQGDFRKSIQDNHIETSGHPDICSPDRDEIYRKIDEKEEADQ